LERLCAEIAVVAPHAGGLPILLCQHNLEPVGSECCKPFVIRRRQLPAAEEQAAVDLMQSGQRATLGGLVKGTGRMEAVADEKGGDKDLGFTRL
jgi:hypothetical protein